MIRMLRIAYWIGIVLYGATFAYYGVCFAATFQSPVRESHPQQPG